MRKLIIIIGIVLSINGFCQNTRKVFFKIEYGPSLSIPPINTYVTPGSGSANPITKYKIDFGCFLDLLVDFDLSKRFVLTTGIGYLFNNYKIDDKIGFEERKGHLTHSDINVPLLLNFRVTKNSPFFITLGPYAALKISANETGTKIIDTSKLVGTGSNGQPVHGYYLGIEPVQKYNNKVLDGFKKIDYGLTGQISYRFLLSLKFVSKPKDCILFTRFNLGLTDTFKHENAYKWQDYNFQIGTGFRF